MNMTPSQNMMNSSPINIYPKQNGGGGQHHRRDHSHHSQRSGQQQATARELQSFKQHEADIQSQQHQH